MTDTVPDATTRVIEHVRVPMADGVDLAATVHLRADRPWPVLLVRTPYSEQMSRLLPVAPALDAGFAVMVQSCRGTGRSGGRLRTFEHETADGLATLDWLTAQPWCDGRIALFGASYLGMVQLAISGHRPPGLAAIAPTVTPEDYRDGLAYRQGAFALGQALGWHLMKAGQALADAAALGEDVTDTAARVAALAADPEATYRMLPLADRPGITDLLPSWRTWLDKETDPDYWHGISYTASRAATAVPGLHVGGWFDLFLRGTLANYQAISSAPQHLVVGPWTHTDQTGIAGELCYPGGAAQAIQLEQQQIRFLADSVHGRPSTLPPVRIYVMGAGWRDEQEWPLARTEWQTWYFGADGGLGRAPAPAGALDYVHDPHDPVPTVGGAILMAGSRDGRLGYQAGSRDQRELDDRTDILRFTSAPLAADVEITGPLSVRLFAATSAVDTDFTAKLVEVYPDGRAMAVADGIVRARYRDGMDAPRPVVPGDVVEYPIDLGATSQVFAAGHRVRVDVASSNFPCHDRNSGSGKPAGQVTEADFGCATQRVHVGADRPSAIRLPVIPPH